MSRAGEARLTISQQRRLFLRYPRADFTATRRFIWRASRSPGSGTAFRIDTPGGKRVYVDPWLSNPKCPEGEQEPERVDLIALTHGHDDHVGETVALAKRFDSPVVATVELRAGSRSKVSLRHRNTPANKGGTVDVDGVRITFTDAKHSSGGPNGEYLGEPAGLVVDVEG